MKYGKEDCKHVWRFRKNGWEEECVPAVCVECGAYGCQCDMYGAKMPDKEIFFGEGVNGDANTNGKWVNPYIKKQ